MDGRLEMECHRGTLRVLHEPRQPFGKGERRMIDNPKKHRGGPQGIEVVAAWIRNRIGIDGVGGHEDVWNGSAGACQHARPESILFSWHDRRSGGNGR